MLPQLTATEARVIGCLMEKAVTTPDQYPLTLNALTNAANQKSSREPVIALKPAEVQRAARALAYGPESRYGHPISGTIESVEGLTREELVGHFNGYYGPGDATLIVAGDVTLDDVMSIAEARLGDWDRLAAWAANDFEAVVCRTHPPVADALAALRATAPLVALVCGSGSASFALYDTEGGAESAAAGISRSAQFRMFTVRTLTAWPNWT